MRSALSIAALAVTGALLLAGCSTTGQPGPAPSGSAPASAAFDPAVLAKLTPEGHLKTPAKMSINIPSKVILDVLAPVIADQLGILKTYGITLDVQVGSTANALPLLATGKLDAMLGGATAGLFNAISDGGDFRIVAPGGHPTADAKTGFYASKAWLAGRTFTPALLKGSKHGSSLGTAGVTIVNYVQMLKSANLSVQDIQVTTMPEADQIIALGTGAIATGTLSEVAAVKASASGDVVRIGPQVPDGWPPVVFVFGSSLIKERPEVGLAFTAAMRDLYQHDLQGDWLKSPKVLDALSAGAGLSESSIAGLVPYAYPAGELSLPSDYVSLLDSSWRLFPGVLKSTTPTATDGVVDERFMDYANSLKP